MVAHTSPPSFQAGGGSHHAFEVTLALPSEFYTGWCYKVRPRLKTKSTAGTLKYQTAHSLAFRRKRLKKGTP